MPEKLTCARCRRVIREGLGWRRIGTTDQVEHLACPRPARDSRRPRLPCPVCGGALSATEPVVFQGQRLIHARCWPGDDTPPRVCAKCRKLLDRYEPAAYQGRVVYHLRCWGGSQRQPPSQD
jgi:hypothetical protein